MSLEELKELYSREFSNGYWDLIENNLDKDLNWYCISRNQNITWEIISNNWDKPWSWDGISWNSNLTWEIISNNLEKPWNWGYISLNKMDKGKDKWIKEHIRKEILKKVSYRLLCLKNDDKDINEMICDFI